MSVHFHPLRIRAVKKETPDCVLVSFEIPEQLGESFRYTQGQSLTMRKQIGGQEVRRTYSICSSPLEPELKVAIKKVEGGLFSIFANDQLQAGDVIDVMEPVGRFYTLLDPAQQKFYLAFAAGSGITPVLSLIKTTLATEPRSSFTLVYGNRSKSSIIFFEELEALKNRYMERFNLVHVLSRERTDSPLNSGRIDLLKLEELSRAVPFNRANEIFICGPQEMIFATRNFLLDRGIGSSRIHFELFTTPGRSVQEKRDQPLREAGGPVCQVTVKIDGRSFDFPLPLNTDTSLLEAALAQGADLPFACKGGVCSTCKARLLEGEVSMDVHWGLEDSEVEAGYILTCQSHPKSQKLLVDFDLG